MSQRANSETILLTFAPDWTSERKHARNASAEQASHARTACKQHNHRLKRRAYALPVAVKATIATITMRPAVTMSHQKRRHQGSWSGMTGFRR